MAKLTRHGVMGLALATAIAAGCQAQAPVDPGVALHLAATDPTRAAFRQALGLPPLLQRRPPNLLPAAPRFSVSATDSLWGAEITISTATGDQEYPDVAYNTTAKNYMVAYQTMSTDGTNSDLIGQLVTNAGTTSGTAITLSNASGYQLAPRIVYNSSANEYLVAWTDTRAGNSDVYTLRISATGTLPSAAVAVASGSGSQTLAGLTYHSSQNQYLVTWTDDATGSSILKGARMSAANAKVGSDVTISGVAGALANAGATVNTSTGEYLVAWANPAGVQLQKLTSAGVLSGGATAIATGAAYEFYAPRVVYNTFTPGYMLVYDRRTTASGAAEAMGQRLTTAGAASGAAFVISTAAGDQLLPSVSFNNSDGNYLVAWSDGRAGTEDLDVYSKIYKADGTVHLAEYVVSATTNLQALPALAFDSNRKQFLFLWQDARAYATQGYNIYAQRAASAPLTATEVMDETLETFNNMESGNAGGANGARSQLENAISKIAADKPANAITHLTNFINSLPTLQTNGVISAEERTILENMANEAIAQIQAGNY